MEIDLILKFQLVPMQFQVAFQLSSGLDLIQMLHQLFDLIFHRGNYATRKLENYLMICCRFSMLQEYHS